MIMEKRNVVNFINFIRGVDPRVDYSLVEPVVEQIKIHNELGIKCTFLIQYDALLNPEYTELLKGLDRSQYEIGVWLEIVQPLVEKIGLKWNGRFPWDWHAHCGFSVGYTIEQRKAMIDELFEKFKETFGYYPTSMGSWAFDAATAAYAHDKYGMKAFCNCKEQWGTDGYTMWGGYYGQGYYPSRMNSYSPAQNEAYQIKVPVFRMLGSDPVYQYDCGTPGDNGQDVITLEPVYTGNGGGGGNPEWVDWFLKTNYNNNNLEFSYVQAGQENSFGWADMKDGYLDQIGKIKEMQDKGLLVTEKLSETGEWYQNTYKTTPANTIVALDDWQNSNKKSVWYNCKNYRANLFADGENFKIRDIHVFDEKYSERYRDDTCKTDYLQFDTLPVIDGNRFSGNGILAGAYPYEVVNGEKKALKFKEVLYEELGGNAVVTFTETSCGDIEITLAEEKITILCSDETKDFGFECKFDPQANNAIDGPKQLSDKADRLPKIESINGKDLILSHRGFPYALKLEQGSWAMGGIAAESENGVIELKIK